jgi:hypothetical protein
MSESEQKKWTPEKEKIAVVETGITFGLEHFRMGHIPSLRKASMTCLKGHRLVTGALSRLGMAEGNPDEIELRASYVDHFDGQTKIVRINRRGESYEVKPVGWIPFGEETVMEEAEETEE